MKNNPFYLVIHHSATRDHSVHDNFSAIKRYHMGYAVDGVTVSKDKWEAEKFINPFRYFKKPWRDIGYHYVLEYTDGNPIIKSGRKPDQKGAHTYQKLPNRNGKLLSTNWQSIGLCVIGNFDEYKMPFMIHSIMIAFIESLLDKYNIPISNVLGHREIPGVHKTCPGNYTNMVNIRNILKNLKE